MTTIASRASSEPPTPVWPDPAAIRGHGVPLVIGVTGHRDLSAAEVPLLEDSVERFLVGLRTRFPDLPLMILTPLAEGADRLVARVAKRMQLQVAVLLPMPTDLYRTDFDKASDEVFAEMAGGHDVIELPLLPGTLAEDVSEPGAARDRQYEYLGVYLAAHCHILLALWDGRDSPAPGGTARVVRIHQHDVSALLGGGSARSPIDFTEDESDLVYHLACSRAGVGPPADGVRPGDGAWLIRDDTQPRVQDLPSRYALVFARLGQFNRDLRALPTAAPCDTLWPQAAQSDAEPCAEMHALYQVADALALHYKRRALFTLRTLFTLVGTTGACFILYADFAGLDVMIYGYLASLSLALLAYLFERRRQWFRRYLDYRVLSESLRVQFYWALAGVGQQGNGGFAHDQLLKRQDLELGWIRNLMRFAGRRVDATAHAATAGTLATVITAWIGSADSGQFGYYRQAMTSTRKRTLRTERLVNACFTAGIGLAMGLAFWGTRIDGLLQSALIALMGGLPFAAAIRQSYAHRIAERENAAQFAYMARLLGNARRLLDGSQSDAARREILRALGEAAIEEHGLWLLRQRERPLSSGHLLGG